ncbi:MAG TPA: hypothetical protein VI029_01685 [Mycobacterium sp.]
MAPMRMTRFGIVPSRGAAATLGALALAAGGMAFAGVANAAPPFIGTYTAVQKSFMIDPQTGAQLAQPDQVSTWIATSYCSISGCTTHIVSNSLNALDMVFDGKQWNRLAMPPQTGNCGGATVPARGAVEVLLPQADGSLSGALTSTVDCGGRSVAVSQPITVTPS